MAWGIGKLAHRWLPHVTTGLSPRGIWILRGARALVAVMCLLLLAYAGNFNDPGNPLAGGLRLPPVCAGDAWDQRANYQRNGFVAGLLLQHPASPRWPSRPGLLQGAHVEEIAQRYERRRPRQMNEGRTGTLVGHQHRLRPLGELHRPVLAQDGGAGRSSLAPKTKAEMAKTVSGRMLSPGYGGGTANIEFELLTGQSLSQFNPQLDSLYEQVVEQVPGVPLGGEVVRRPRPLPRGAAPVLASGCTSGPKVFDTFGFKELIDKDHMDKQVPRRRRPLHLRRRSLRERADQDARGAEAAC